MASRQLPVQRWPLTPVPALSGFSFIARIPLISATARIPIFRAARTPLRIGAYTRKKMSAVIAQILTGGH
jgi:hypothetical protein